MKHSMIGRAEKFVGWSSMPVALGHSLQRQFMLITDDAGVFPPVMSYSCSFGERSGNQQVKATRQHSVEYVELQQW
ncbi:hypothetical protein TNCV_4865111 [Trichonephila clavipes]|nr:hypothetical protein TNCV_4865111 [Trichonephila clavipes]